MVVEDIRAQRPTNNAILWVATGTSPRLLAGLFYSIASVIWTGGLSSVDRERFAYVVAHDSLACADVTARFPRACHELDAHAFAPRGPRTNASCAAAPEPLARGGDFVLLNVSRAIDDARLDRFLAAARGQGNALGLERRQAALGSTFRWIADTYLLTIGVKRFVYLDVDTCVSQPLARVLSSKTKLAPVVVARRSTRESGAQSNQWTRLDPAARKQLEDVWGFDAARHQFNAGVLFVDAEQYCALDAYERIISAAEQHASMIPRAGLVNVFAEVALARHVVRISEHWNCRRQFSHRDLAAAPANVSDICPSKVKGPACGVVHAPPKYDRRVRAIRPAHLARGVPYHLPGSARGRGGANSPAELRAALKAMREAKHAQSA